MTGNERIVIIDCQTAGISGDMIIGALLDLGANLNRVTGAMESAKKYTTGCKNLEITVKDSLRQGIHAKNIDIRTDQTVNMTAPEIIDATIKCVKNQKVSPKAEHFAENSIKTLINAEAKVHGKNAAKVHLHETGSADTLADIVGVTVALEDLGLFEDAKVYSTPVAVGGGLFKFSHGVVSSPAPATVEVLRSRRFHMIGGPVNSELATPTGVSLLVNMVQEVTKFYPPIEPTDIGYGAGSKDFPEMPNVLRIVVGEPVDYGLLRDNIYVLETSVDDVTGEVIGYTMDKLMQEGAREVDVIPIFTKKNRPAFILKIMTTSIDAERLSRILMEETGSLGVRVYPCNRYILKRETRPIELEVEGKKHLINVKVARDREGNIVQIKPEYDEVKRLADRTQKPLREIMRIVETKARESITEKLSR